MRIQTLSSVSRERSARTQTIEDHYREDVILVRKRLGKVLAHTDYWRNPKLRRTFISPMSRPRRRHKHETSFRGFYGASRHSKNSLQSILFIFIVRNLSTLSPYITNTSLHIETFIPVSPSPFTSFFFIYLDFHFIYSSIFFCLFRSAICSLSSYTTNPSSLYSNLQAFIFGFHFFLLYIGFQSTHFLLTLFIHFLFTPSIHSVSALIPFFHSFPFF